ncbi:transcriptional regulator, TetR family [Roseateles sp. YR242]|uniref:TetR/AcrR family transcriptional regulator n=1 Tax=Roseateles sp. YR242 TaxID=1855305 RepID=UPI0008CD0755|nr:TetR/AcrR family transcriptional regulator [Roseateles sp. YR242]SEL77149.1 transcriptional regulator, TetR family [Roseateles sp. YR242]
METAKTARSELTQSAIVDVALEMARTDGLESLSVGEVAKRLNLSKSGVFSRIGSREALQCAVIDAFEKTFQHEVLLPALREPRGLPRLNAMVKGWLARVGGPNGSCLYVSGAFELDDREGELRDRLLEGVRRWRATLHRTLIQAREAGHLQPDADLDQLIFELDGLFTALVREVRFLRNPDATARAWASFERLIRHYQA